MRALQQAARPFAVLATHLARPHLAPPTAGWKAAAAAPVVVAALRGWAFLLTTVPAHRLDAHFVESHLGPLAQLLNGSDVDVRGAAGEAIALLWQMGDLSSLPESPRPSAHGGRPHNTLAALAVGTPPSSPAAARGAPPAGSAFGSSPPAGGAANGASNGASPAAAGSAAASPAAAPSPEAEAEAEAEEDWEESVDSLDAIVGRMRDLAKNRGDASRLSKGDRASSRGTFRDLLAIIEVGEVGGWGGVGWGHETVVEKHKGCVGRWAAALPPVALSSPSLPACLFLPASTHLPPPTCLHGTCLHPRRASTCRSRR